jgi:hypothetical protein
MARSQNGWPVLTESPPRVDLAPGVSVSILPGDVAWLLRRVAQFIHANVERLNTPVIEGGRVLPTDDWGWAYRPIRGQETGYSNHASATAIDLNATQHPRGVKRTWTAAEIAEIDRHLAEYEGVVRWGEHYSTTVDGMHFEINATPAQVRRVRTKIQAADAAREAAEMPTADEVAKATLERKFPLFSYVDRLYNDADNQMNLAEATQHGAGQAYAANQSAGRAATAAEAAARSAQAVQEQVTVLTAQVTELTRVVALLAANETPPASGAGG